MIVGGGSRQSPRRSARSSPPEAPPPRPGMASGFVGTITEVPVRIEEQPEGTLDCSDREGGRRAQCALGRGIVEGPHHGSKRNTRQGDLWHTEELQTREVPLPRFLVERIAVMRVLKVTGWCSTRRTVARCAPAASVGGVRHVSSRRHQQVFGFAISGTPRRPSPNRRVHPVQRMLGHSTLTLDRHSHLYSDDLDALADRLGERHRVSVAARVRPKPASTVVSFERS